MRRANGRQELRMGGTGGQGLILSAKMLADALSSGGKQVAQSQTYEPTSRGGYCNSDLVIADQNVDYPLATALDYLVLLDQLAVEPSRQQLKPGALIVADTRLCPDPPEGEFPTHRLPISRCAIDLGSERVANIVALGVLAALSGICTRGVLEQAVRRNTPKSFLDLNMDALAAGYSLSS
jgi:2-oxoglutarate ferredoxin oxidoreductase subunit gamma